MPRKGYEAHPEPDFRNVLERKTNSRLWYLKQAKRDGGKWCCLFTPIRQAAEQVAVEYHLDPESFHKTYLRLTARNLRFWQLVEHYSEWRREHYPTVHKPSKDIIVSSKLVEGADPTAWDAPVLDLREVTGRRLIEYMSHLGYTTNTIRTKMGQVMRLISWGVEEGLLPPDFKPLDSRHIPPAQRTQRTLRLTSTQILQLFPLPEDPDAEEVGRKVMRGWLHLLWATGCRPQELLALRARCRTDREAGLRFEGTTAYLGLVKEKKLAAGEQKERWVPLCNPELTIPAYDAWVGSEGTWTIQRCRRRLEEESLRVLRVRVLPSDVKASARSDLLERHPPAEVSAWVGTTVNVLMKHYYRQRPLAPADRF